MPWRRLTARTSVRAAATSLAIAAAGAALLWWLVPDSTFVRSWMPNIVTDLASIAVGITLVEWILRRERQERAKPQLVPILREIASIVRGLAGDAWVDYAMTHVANYETPPRRVEEIVAHWQRGLRPKTPHPSRRRRRSSLPRQRASPSSSSSSRASGRRSTTPSSAPPFVRSARPRSKALLRIVSMNPVGVIQRGPFDPVAKLRKEREDLAEFAPYMLGFVTAFVRVANHFRIENTRVLADDNPPGRRSRRCRDHFAASENGTTGRIEVYGDVRQGKEFLRSHAVSL